MDRRRQSIIWYCIYISQPAGFRLGVKGHIGAPVDVLFMRKGLFFPHLLLDGGKKRSKEGFIGSIDRLSIPADHGVIKRKGG